MADESNRQDLLAAAIALRARCLSIKTEIDAEDRAALDRLYSVVERLEPKWFDLAPKPESPEKRAHGPGCECGPCRPHVTVAVQATGPLPGYDMPEPLSRSPAGQHDAAAPLPPKPCARRHPDGARWCNLPDGHDGYCTFPPPRELPRNEHMPRRER